jgi:trimethylamine:corrinoid methyltransferase-like protein
LKIYLLCSSSDPALKNMANINLPGLENVSSRETASTTQENLKKTPPPLKLDLPVYERLQSFAALSSTRMAGATSVAEAAGAHVHTASEALGGAENHRSSPG